MDDSNMPRWVAIVLGLISMLIGVLVIATVAGWLPAEGEMLAPPWVVASFGGVFAVFGLLLFIPEGALQSVRSFLFIGVLVLVAIICNWSGFAPDASYSSSGSLSFGPVSWEGQVGDGGARIVFMLAAITFDVFLIYGFGRWFWSWIRSD